MRCTPAEQHNAHTVRILLDFVQAPRDPVACGGKEVCQSLAGVFKGSRPGISRTAQLFRQAHERDFHGLPAGGEVQVR